MASSKEKNTIIPANLGGFFYHAKNDNSYYFRVIKWVIRTNRCIKGNSECIHSKKIDNIKGNRSSVLKIKNILESFVCFFSMIICCQIIHFHIYSVPDDKLFLFVDFLFSHIDDQFLNASS